MCIKRLIPSLTRWKEPVSRLQRASGFGFTHGFDCSLLYRVMLAFGRDPVVTKNYHCWVWGCRSGYKIFGQALHGVLYSPGHGKDFSPYIRVSAWP